LTRSAFIEHDVAGATDLEFVLGEEPRVEQPLAERLRGAGALSVVADHLLRLGVELRGVRPERDEPLTAGGGTVDRLRRFAAGPVAALRGDPSLRLGQRGAALSLRPCRVAHPVIADEPVDLVGLGDGGRDPDAGGAQQLR
jgi:hypothetical protein